MDKDEAKRINAINKIFESVLPAVIVRSGPEGAVEKAYEVAEMAWRERVTKGYVVDCGCGGKK